MKKHAFTLAEMLIVIGIIGVVAALVIPSLIANYQKRVIMTQLKKAYAEISQAGVMAVAKEDGSKFPNTKPNVNGTFINDYFKKSKDCGWGRYAYKECFGAEYTWDGYTASLDNLYGLGDNPHCIIAKAGYALCLSYPYPWGLLDVNGPKGPNVFGKDTFPVIMANNGNLHAYSPELAKVMNNDWDYDIDNTKKKEKKVAESTKKAKKKVSVKKG